MSRLTLTLVSNMGSYFGPVLVDRLGLRRPGSPDLMVQVCVLKESSLLGAM